MKLSQVFSSIQKQNTVTGDNAKAETERFETQIKTLAPGRTLQGEIVEKNGNEVRIKVSEDVYFVAKLEQDVNVVEGQLLTFEVRNNGKTLSLSPLFTNTAVADNVLKALKMANIPIQNTTISMTETMMKQGMSIDSKSLQTMFKELVANPGASGEDIVILKQMGIPVEENNIKQLQNYQELTHQLVRGITDILFELPKEFAAMVNAGESEEAVSMFRELIQLFSNSEQTVTTVSPEETAVLRDTVGISETTQNVNSFRQDTVLPTDIELTQSERKQLVILLEELPIEELPTKEYVQVENLTTALRMPTQTPDFGELFQLLQNLPTLQSKSGENLTAAFFQNDTVQKLFKNIVLKQWTIEPKELMEKEVREVYERLDKQLSGMRTILAEHGAGESRVAGSVQNLTNNIEFMNQMNQLYTYIQLPLRMQNGEKNGELYVYTNKRSLAEKDGNISALLHLDMEHLGPVDVYVTLQNNRATTHFTVRDDEILDFLNAHMDILSKRLEKKGYTLNWEMTMKEDAGKESPVERLLQIEKSNRLLSQYAFDVRT